MNYAKTSLKNLKAQIQKDFADSNEQLFHLYKWTCIHLEKNGARSSEMEATLAPIMMEIMKKGQNSLVIKAHGEISKMHMDKKDLQKAFEHISNAQEWGMKDLTEIGCDFDSLIDLYGEKSSEAKELKKLFKKTKKK